jgi:hypothetical protein
MKVLKIYCDTDTLVNNIRRHQTPKEQNELDALDKLLSRYRAGDVVLYRSAVNLRETERTADQEQRRKLLEDYTQLTPIPEDVKYLGSYSLPGGTTGVMASDVQDDAMRDQLCQIGLKRKDAEHLTQAICNHCDVFLTRDERSIIKHRVKIEAHFPIKVRKPSELVAEI